jgi:hypothetical protein
MGSHHFYFDHADHFYSYVDNRSVERAKANLFHAQNLSSMDDSILFSNWHPVASKREGEF